MTLHHCQLCVRYALYFSRYGPLKIPVAGFEFLIISRKSGCGNRFGRICLCVCLSVSVRVSVLFMLKFFERLDLECLFWNACIFSEYLGQFHMSRSSGQGQGHSSKKAIYTNVTNKHTRLWSSFDKKAIGVFQGKVATVLQVRWANVQGIDVKFFSGFNIGYQKSLQSATF